MSRRKKGFTNYEINKNIAKILVLHRVWDGLNQTKIAKDLNVSFQQIQKYEKCMNRISAEMPRSVGQIPFSKAISSPSNLKDITGSYSLEKGKVGS